MPRTKLVSDDAVLDAVARMIVRHGPHRMTLSHVGREVRLSPATLLQRFGSKKALLRAFATRSAATAPALFVKRGSPLGSLRASLRSMAATLRDRRTLPNNLAMLLEDLRDPSLSRSAAAQTASVEREIRSRIRAAIDAGELADQDAAALARTVHAAWNGAVLTWALHGTGTLERWIDRVMDPLLTPRAAVRFPVGPRSA